MTDPYFAPGDLLPCPHCGGEAELSRGTQSGGQAWFYIECLTCAAMSEVEAWNKRVAHPPAADLLPGLREASALRETLWMMESDHIVRGSPGPLYAAGWAAACQHWAKRIRALDHAEEQEIYCHACSKAGGAERAIYHLPPECAAAPTINAEGLPGNAPAKDSRDRQEAQGPSAPSASETPETDALASKWSLKGGNRNGCDASPEAREIYLLAASLERRLRAAEELHERQCVQNDQDSARMRAALRELASLRAREWNATIKAVEERLTGVPVIENDQSRQEARDITRRALIVAVHEMMIPGAADET